MHRPRAVSLTLNPKMERAPRAILRVDEEEAWFELGGDEVPSSVWLTGTREQARVSLLTRSSPESLGKSSVVDLGAWSQTGRLSMRRVQEVEAEGFADLSAGTKVITYGPELIFAPETGYRHVVR